VELCQEVLSTHWHVRELIWSVKLRGNFVDGPGKLMCSVRVVSMLFIFVENVKIYNHCIL